MAEKVKTPEEMVEEELNKDMAKAIARRKKEINRKKAEIKKLEKEIEKIKSGELVPDGEDDLSSDLSPKRNPRVAFLLDESGSMSSCKAETIEGFNEYIKKLRNSGNGIRMTFTKFDSSKVNTLFKDKSIGDVPLLNDDSYQPGAMTPLLDAIGRTIDAMKKFKDVLFIIQTDGFENASKEYTRDSIKKKIKEFTDKNGWEFVYLGADQDAFLSGKDYGLSRGQTFSYMSMDTSDVFGSGAACYTSDWAAGKTIGVTFSSHMKSTMDKVKKKKGK